jgi:hypothetical protein
MLKLKLLCLSLFVGTSLFAADRALLVGVGDYPAGVRKLPGIDKDIRMFRDSLVAIGFKPDTIHTLMDGKSTDAAIRQEVQNWLTKGVGPNDRVVFFFSGHGSTMNDGGRAVGVLVPYDIQASAAAVKNALKGPELGELLNRIPSHRVLVVIDACHSGRLTEKSLNLGVIPKFFSYPGMPNDEPDFENLMSKDIKAVANHVVLAACKRNEVAGATKDGSILTLSVQQRVASLAPQCKPVTVRNLYVSQLGDKMPQHPEYSGDPSLFDYNWNTNRCNPTVRQAAAPVQTVEPTRIDSDDAAVIDRIYEASEHGMAVQISKPLYHAGDTMEITVDVPTDGYLNIVSVGDGEPRASILFPNQYSQDNFVHAGRVVVPASGAKFRLRQSVPAGMNSQNNAVLILFSPAQKNLYQEGIGDGAFRLMGQGTRGTAPEPLANPFTSELIYYKITN